MLEMEQTNESLGLVLDALAFAARKHRDQRRKDPEASPYINHPIALAFVLCNEAHIKDTEILCAAILHDTLEDTATSVEELSRRFGESVCLIVQEVSDDKTLPSQMRKRLQIEHAANSSRQAKLVKLADKICNLRDIASSPPLGWSLSRRQEYFEWARQVIDQLRGVHAGLEALFDATYADKPVA